MCVGMYIDSLSKLYDKIIYDLHTRTDVCRDFVREISAVSV